MKKLIRSYISFTRTERIGLVCLCSLLVVLIVVRASMYLWVHPKTEHEQEQKLAAAWATFKRSQSEPTVDDTVEHKKNDWQDTFDDNTTPLPDTINLNTADSATLVRLKGIGPVTAGKIIARRVKKGPYTDLEQIREAGAFSTASFELLKKHLRVQ